METKWPETVPVLKAGDICRGRFTCGNQHCLSGWLREVRFGDVAEMEFRNAIADAADRRRLFGNSKSVVDLNDTEQNSLADVATIWNDAAKAVGYVRDGEVYRRVEPASM